MTSSPEASLRESLTDLIRCRRFEAALERFQAAVSAAEDEPPNEADGALLAEAGTEDALRALLSWRRWSELGEAEGALQRALSHSITAAEANNLLGVLAAEEGRDEDAMRFFNRCLALDERHFRALTNRGALHLEGGDLQAAEADLQAAIAIEPKHHGAHQNMAVLLRKKGDRAASVKSLKLSARLDREQATLRGEDMARAERRRQPWILPGLALALMAFFLLAFLLLR